MASAFCTTTPFPSTSQNHILDGENRFLCSRYVHQQTSYRRTRMVVTEGGGSGYRDREGPDSLGKAEDVRELVGKGEKKHAVASAISTKPSLNEALADASAKCFGRLKEYGCTEPPDLAVLFISSRYSVGFVGRYGRESLDTVVRSLKTFLPGIGVITGCTADGVAGQEADEAQEVFDRAAVSVVFYHLPGVEVRPFHVMPEDLPGLDAGQETWRKLVGGFPLSQKGTPSFITFGDPTFASRGGLDEFLEGVDFAYPRCSVAGALATAAVGSGSGNMFVTLPRDVLDPSSSSLRESGMVGVALQGDVELDCLVAQGSRPMGPVYEVSGLRESGPNIVVTLMKRPGLGSGSQWPKTHLESLMEFATPTERRLMESSLCLRVARDIFKEQLTDDNFLTREIVSVDRDGGGIELSCSVKEGDRVQFCVNDAEFAADNLKQSLQKYKRGELAKNLLGYSSAPFSILLFGDSIWGRGMFRVPGLEAQQLASYTGGVPIGGFFSWCGQIGPAMSKNEKGYNNTRGFHHHAACVVAFLRRKDPLSS